MSLRRDREKFLRAARGGDLKTIKKLIFSNKISLKDHDEMTDGDGYTALMWASENGYLDIVHLLLEDESVNVDGTGHLGITPLHCASEEGRVEAMKYLIKKGADVNLPSYCEGETPLHPASQNGRLHAVKLLLEMGVDATQVDEDNHTPLDRANLRGYESVAKEIRRHLERPQQIQTLLRNINGLPTSIWPNVISHISSTNFIFGLVREIPFLFKSTSDVDGETETQREQDIIKQRFIIITSHPDCQVCNNNNKNNNNKGTKRKKRTPNEAGKRLKGTTT